MAAWFEPLFTSGRIIDLILVLVAAETVLLASAGRRLGYDRLWADVAPTLASGVLLLVTLRLVIAGSWWGWVASTLLLALAAHLVDLYMRLQARKHRRPSAND